MGLIIDSVLQNLRLIKWKGYLEKIFKLNIDGKYIYIKYRQKYRQRKVYKIDKNRNSYVSFFEK